MDVLAPGHQVGALGDAGRRLQLVARQHPDLDPTPTSSIARLRDETQNTRTDTNVVCRKTNV